MDDRVRRRLLNWLAAVATLVGSGRPVRAETGGGGSAAATGSSRHWAFQMPQRPPAPALLNQTWARNPVDHFIGARLERERIQPAPEADRTTLLRRIHLDLVGLPPSPEDVESFLNDPTPNAYERRVEQLLASPHFGERWGRHWLDLARYADSSGYQVDRERPWAWVYRDWVIRSLNQDQPFDRFTVEQLAGDLIFDRSEHGVPNPELLVAAGFHRLALSNHEDGVDAEEFAVRTRVDRVATTGTAWLGLTLACAECHSHKYDPISQREFYQIYAFFNAAEEAEQIVDANRHAYTFRQRAEPPKTFIHIRGDFLRRGEEVQPAFLSSVNPPPSPQTPTRLELAQWLVSPDHPLTARVAVNQIWLHLFGRGLVSTTEDFGTRGERPSHPELLDWLAREFVSTGWSRKQMIRLLVNSTTYRQSSTARPELAGRDPENRLLARQNRVRLDGEILRDTALAVGGLLKLEVGGPSFRPEMPADVKWLGSAGAWIWTDDQGPVLNRRSLYIYSQRTVPHPLLPVFDQANPNEACTRRERSNNALQALTLLNHGTFVGAARALAEREVTAGDSPRAQINRAFQRCLGRPPAPAESARLEKLHHQIETIAPAQAMFVVAQTLLNLDEFQNRE